MWKLKIHYGGCSGNECWGGVIGQKKIRDEVRGQKKRKLIFFSLAFSCDLTPLKIDPFYNVFQPTKNHISFPLAQNQHELFAIFFVLLDGDGMWSCWLKRKPSQIISIWLNWFFMLVKRSINIDDSGTFAWFFKPIIFRGMKQKDILCKLQFNLTIMWNFNFPRILQEHCTLCKF